MKFRKKPVVIEAIQYKNNAMDIARWAEQVSDKSQYISFAGDGTCVIKTPEGDLVTAIQGDWIICGVKGELYPCKPDIFEETYTLAQAGKPVSGGVIFFGHKDLLTGRHDVQACMNLGTNAVMMFTVDKESKQPFPDPKIWLEVEDVELLNKELTQWLASEKYRRENKSKFETPMSKYFGKKD